MHYPQLRPTRARKQFTQVFGGLNKSLKIRDGEWADTTNLSTRNFPLLSPRAARGISDTALTAPYAIGGNQDGLAYVDGDTLYYKGDAVTGLTLSTASEMTDKRIIAFGAYLIVLPDYAYYNTADASDKGTIGNQVNQAAPVDYTMSRADGTAFTGATVSDTAPEDPVHGDYWIDTSADIHLLMQFSEMANVWVSVPTTFVKLSGTGIGAGFNKGDGVTVSGCQAGDSADESTKVQLAAINGAHIIEDVGADYVVLSGILDQVYTQASGTVTISREMPKMDHVTVCGNRLWGCRCGTNNAGATVNEIYASKLGDFRNFAVFQGISTDSYAVTVGQGGDFTGAASHQGYPVFFKEDVIYKVYGSRPANFQVADTQARGVQAGSDRSLALVNETLFYKSRDGIMSYDGAGPYKVSDALGEDFYDNARAGSVGDKYYISMQDTKDAWHLFVLDVKRNLWMREDATQALGFHTLAGELWWIDSDNKLVTAFGSAGTKETAVSWAAESGLIGYDHPGRHYVSRMNMRVELAAKSKVTAYIKYDSDGDWVSIGERTHNSSTTRTFLWPLIPRRCDHFHIKLVGSGHVAIYSIDKVLERGGDGVGHV